VKRTLLVSTILLGLMPHRIWAQETPPLTPAGSIALPGVSGRIDHLAVDLAGHRLFVAALGNNTVEVVDLRTNARIQSISGIAEPQGVAFVPDSRTLVIASGGDGKCRFYDSDLMLVGAIPKLGDADNVRFDPAADTVYVGYGGGALAAIDATTRQLKTKIALHAHPESFQLDPSGPHIFVNVPGAREVAVVDRAMGTQVTGWPVEIARSNFPMAVDGAHRRLLVGCRAPAKMLVINANTGEIVTALDCAGDADDIFLNAATAQVYVIGGEGVLTVFKQEGADRYRSLASIPTAAGARTGLFVPELGKLFVAAPARDGRQAAILMFDTSR